MPSWKKVIVSGSDAALNSLLVSGNTIISGSLAVGTSSIGPNENTITLGARDNANEGGQIGFNAPGGTYTSASFIDNYTNLIRILKGNNTTSTGLVAQWNLHTTQMQLPAYTAPSSFPGTAAGYLAFDSSGNIITAAGVGGSPFPFTGNAVITGSLTVTQPIYVPINGGMYFRGGDDAELWDINISNHLGIYGAQDSTVASIKLGSGGGTISGKSGNIGIGTINPTSASLTVNGNVWATSFTGSLQGTSSFAITSSYITASNVFGPYGSNSVISSSYAGTASYAKTSSFSLAASANRILVINKSGVTITKGTVVHLTGSNNSSDTPYVTTASYESDGLSANTLGITTDTIAFNSTGYVTTEGVLTGLDVTGFTSGQLVYLGATGSIIGTAPQAPLHSVRLGQVVRDSPSNNGAIYIRVDNGYELGELHDVTDLTTSASYGDLLIKSGSVWTNSKQLTGSYGLTGSLTVTGSTSTDLVRITQTGTGNAFVVEDAANPDSTPFIIDNQGRVGIGTTGSSGFVTMKGVGAIGVTLDTDGYPENDFQSTRLFWKISGSGNDISMRNVSGSLFVATQATANGSSGTVAMAITAPGNVGIGTTGPGASLHLFRTGDPNLMIVERNAEANATVRYKNTIGSMYAGLSTSASFAVGTSTDLMNAFTTFLTISSSGNVGIGTTTPSAKLHVSGTSYFSNNLELNINTKLWSLNASGYYINLANPGTNTLDINGFAGIRLFTGTSSEKMRIASNGNVGIGITTPSASLHITNTSTSASFIVEDSANPDMNPFIIDATGNVGIGTTTPRTALDVAGSIFSQENWATYGFFLGDLDAGASYAYLSGDGASSTNSYLDLSTNVQSRLRITHAGNVGIGTTTPNAKLDVNGDTIITGSLTVTNDFRVLGSASIQYITSSQLNIGDNIISVNTINPAVRFGGIAVIDSGSSPQQSGSLLFDSQNNQWIFVHQSAASAAVTSSVLIMGPQTFNDIGNETTLTANRLAKATSGDLGEHIGNSNITDTGTVVSINSNTEITGSTKITNGSAELIVDSATWAELKYGADNYFRAQGDQAIIAGPLIRLFDGSQETVRVTGGNVSIGTTVTSPTARLHVNNTSSANSFLVEDDSNVDVSPFVIDNVGNVGIGTLTPSHKLHLSHTTGDQLLIERSGGLYYNAHVQYKNLNGSMWAGINQNVDFAIGASVDLLNPTTTYFNIKNTTGNVGVGTASPTNPLHISKTANSYLLDGLKVDRDPTVSSSAIFNAFGGSANIISNSGTTSVFPSILFASSDNTTVNELMRMTTVGLGIGTIPTAKLDVNGNAIITGSLTVSGSLRVGGLILGDGGAQLTGTTSVTGSLVLSGSVTSESSNTISSDALIQASLLYLSNNF